MHLLQDIRMSITNIVKLFNQMIQYLGSELKEKTDSVRVVHDNGRGAC